MIDLRLGDCLDVMRTLPDGCVDAVVTDPPYGIDYQSGHRPKGKQLPKIANDRRPFIWWLYDAFRSTRDGGCLACFCAWQVQEVFRVAIEVAGYTIRSQVIWDRDWHGMGDLKATFGPRHDVIWFATKGQFAFPGKRPQTVLKHRRIDGESLVHPNEKPVVLMTDLVASVCPTRGTVLDCFMGSGTTGVSTAQLGLSFIGVEQDPGYFAIAERRIAAAQPQAIPA